MTDLRGATAWRSAPLIAPITAAAAVFTIAPVTPLGALLTTNVLLGVVLLLIPPRGLTAAKTWVVGYLLMQFPGRSLFLLSQPVEEPPIYRLYLPGVQGDAALREALSQVLLGFVIITLVYVVVVHARPRSIRAPVLDAPVRLTAYYLMLVFGLAALVPEARGGSFLVTIPGLCVAGAGCFVAYSFALHPRRYLVAFSLAVCYGLVRVIFMDSKLALLSALVGLAAGLSVGLGRHRRQAAMKIVIPAAAAVAAVFVFSATIPSDEGSGGQGAIDRGVTAVISRSYGVDSLMAVNSYLALGGRHLHGESFVEIAYSPIPRAIWPSKPVSYSVRFGEAVFYFSPLAGESYFAPSYPGEWEVNFGWPGLLAGWLLLGLFLAAVDSMRSVPRRVLWLTVSTHVIEGSFVAQFWLAVPFLVGGYLVAERTAVEHDPP